MVAAMRELYIDLIDAMLGEVIAPLGMQDIYDLMDSAVDAMEDDEIDNDNLKIAFRMIQRRIMPDLTPRALVERYRDWRVRFISRTDLSRPMIQKFVMDVAEEEALIRGPSEPKICPCGEKLYELADWERHARHLEGAGRARRP